MNSALRITAQAMQQIDTLVRVADTTECMGLLGSKPGADTVTSIEVLPARATATSAEASPLAVKHAADAMAAKDIVPRGIWHSHGRLDVFHSGTDIATIHRLLPAMAMHGYRRDGSIAAPAVEGRDTAVLPMTDGRLMHFTLSSAPVPGTDLAEPATWTRVSVDYASTAHEPSAELSAKSLRLMAAGVIVSLGVPPATQIERRIVDRATMRCARLFSLVVNTRRHRYAQCLVVADFHGETMTKLVDCEVDVVDEGRSGDSDPGAGEQTLEWLLALA
jgi:hypothetical protein